MNNKLFFFGWDTDDEKLLDFLVKLDKESREKEDEHK